MSQEVSEAEYQYYRTEKIKFEELELDSIVMLYATLQKGNPIDHQEAEFSQHDAGRRAYGRELCRISGIFSNSNYTEIDIVFDGRDFMSKEARLKAKDTGVVSVQTPMSLQALHRAFFNVVTDNDLAQIDTDVPNLQIVGKGFYMPDGFFVYTHSHSSDLLQTMMVARGEEGDGSAGAMVPARPKNPSPLKAAEIENPALFIPLQ